MAKNTDKVNGTVATVEAPVKEKRTRTPMHTFKLLGTRINNATYDYFAVVDGKVTAHVRFDDNKFTLNGLVDMMGSFDGYSRFIRRHKDDFRVIVVAKAEDDKYIQAMGQESAVIAALDSMLNATIQEKGFANPTESQKLTAELKA